MNVCVLGSGSRGNAIAVWENGGGLMIDLGLSYKQCILRMEERGIDPEIFGAALITHGHGDHMTSIRKWIEQHGLDIWCTTGTMKAIAESLKLYPGSWKEVNLREPFQVYDFQVYAIPTVHNAEGAVTYIIKAPSGRRLALFIETGVVTPEMFRAGRHSDAYIIEANHDKEMCAVAADRPEFVNQRTMLTHLNNDQAAKLIEHVDPSTQLCVLVHLSSANNEIKLVDEICGAANRRRSRCIPDLVISTQDRATGVHTV